MQNSTGAFRACHCLGDCFLQVGFSLITPNWTWLASSTELGLSDLVNGARTASQVDAQGLYLLVKSDSKQLV